MLDPQDEVFDRRLASHLVSLYHLTERQAEDEFLVIFIIIILRLFLKLFYHGIRWSIKLVKYILEAKYTDLW